MISEPDKKDMLGKPASIELPKDDVLTDTGEDTGSTHAV